MTLEDYKGCTSDCTVIFEPQKSYEAGMTVTLVMADTPALATYFRAEGTVLEDGRIQFKITKAMIDKFADQPFAVLIFT